jgi:hypothetical protein
MPLASNVIAALGILFHWSFQKEANIRVLTNKENHDG